MAIGIVDDSDFQRELEKLGIKSKEEVEIVEIQKGRGNTLEVPENVRQIIADDAIENGNTSAKQIARALRISDSSVSAYKHGSTSTASYRSPDPDLKAKVNHKRLVIGNRARAKLLTAIKHITEEKLADAKLRDLAGVASAMSTVIRNIEPPQETNQGNTQFIFYAPKFRQEESYEVIDVKE